PRARNSVLAVIARSSATWQSSTLSKGPRHQDYFFFGPDKARPTTDGRNNGNFGMGRITISRHIGS
ncbi:MAG: hypothetical protein O6922_07250, partial [Chloroflexi bacterium]|nr:hypothetical protein [Chloroflexota bacterium]